MFLSVDLVSPAETLPPLRGLCLLPAPSPVPSRHHAGRLPRRACTQPAGAGPPFVTPGTYCASRVTSVTPIGAGGAQRVRSQWACAPTCTRCRNIGTSTQRRPVARPPSTGRHGALRFTEDTDRKERPPRAARSGADGRGCVAAQRRALALRFRAADPAPSQGWSPSASGRDPGVEL